MLLRGLPLVVELGLLIYCVIDCIQTPDGAQRDLPKPVWLLLIVCLPFLGGIFWLFAGRPPRESGTGDLTGFPEYQERHGRRPVAPDDDPDFLGALGSMNAERQRTLGQRERNFALSEDDLRRREDGEEPEAR